MVKMIGDYLNKYNVAALAKSNNFAYWDSMNNKIKVSKLAERLLGSWHKLFDKKIQNQGVNWLIIQ